MKHRPRAALAPEHVATHTRCSAPLGLREQQRSELLQSRDTSSLSTRPGLSSPQTCTGSRGSQTEPQNRLGSQTQ